VHGSRVYLSLSVGLILLLLAGCSSNSNSNSTNGPSGNNSSGVPVSLSMTDDPPNGVTVLFFQISLTSAYLTPASGSGNVSLLTNNTPIQVDVTQLQALSAFLSTANVAAGNYNSLTLTFANPQLVIFNASDQAIANKCPLNTVCQLMPQIDNSPMLTFSTAPFPVMVSTGAPLGFLLDFHLNNVIQSDLSVNLAIANGVTISQLPSTPPIGPPQFGFVQGTVQGVNANQNQFTIQTRWGWTLTVDVNASTSYEGFPGSACTMAALSCVASGDVVQVQVANVQMDDTLLAASVSYIQTASQQVVQGNIINLSTSGSNTIMTLLLHWSPDANLMPLGSMAMVAVPTTATYTVDSGNFTIPSGLAFSSAADLLVHQQVQVNVLAGTLGSPGVGHPWAPIAVSFTTNSVELEPSQTTGKITAINSNGSGFTMTALPNFFTPWQSSNGTVPVWTPPQVTIETTSQTTFEGLSPNSFSGLSVNDLVSVRGWLFAMPSAATASTQVAETVLGRPNGFF
jgi:hypothetical protein